MNSRDKSFRFGIDRQVWDSFDDGWYVKFQDGSLLKVPKEAASVARHGWTVVDLAEYLMDGINAGVNPFNLTVERIK